jgi:predicted O-methyltransferase YrrM
MKVNTQELFTTIKQLNNQDLNGIDLDNLSSLITDESASGYFLGLSGDEHYRLLSQISNMLDSKILLDVGTFKGCSALALSMNQSNELKSFDINPGHRRLSKVPDNVEFIIDDILRDQYKDLILSSPFILLDTDHTGPVEHEFYSHIKSLGWRGVLLLDDIHLNDPMKEFWSSIQDEKEDITSIGHWSGTGLVHIV